MDSDGLSQLSSLIYNDFKNVNNTIAEVYNKANSAYDSVSAAYDKANSAYDSVSSAYNQANAAYNKANSAYSSAEKIYRSNAMPIYADSDGCVNTGLYSYYTILCSEGYNYFSGTAAINILTTPYVGTDGYWHVKCTYTNGVKIESSRKLAFYFTYCWNSH